MAFDWSLKHTPRPWSLAHIKQGFQLAGPMTNDEWVLVRQAMTAHLKKSDLLSIYFIAKEPRAQLTASIDEFQQSWPILLSLPRPYKSWAKMAIRYLAVHCTQNHHRLEKKAEGEKNNDSDSVTSRRSQSSAPTNPSTFSSSEAMRTADISHLSTYSSIGKVVAAPRAFQIQDRDNDQHTASFPIEDALTPQDQRDHAAPLHWTHLSFETFLASVQEQVPHLQQLRIFCAGISIQNQKSFQTQCMLQWGDTEIKFDMCGTADYAILSQVDLRRGPSLRDVLGHEAPEPILHNSQDSSRSSSSLPEKSSMLHRTRKRKSNVVLDSEDDEGTEHERKKARKEAKETTRIGDKVREIAVALKETGDTGLVLFLSAFWANTIEFLRGISG